MNQYITITKLLLYNLFQEEETHLQGHYWSSKLNTLIFRLCSCLPIYILLWGHGVGDLLRVDLMGGVQGQLDDKAVDGRVLIHLSDAVKNLKTGKTGLLSFPQTECRLKKIKDHGRSNPSSPPPLLQYWEVSCVWHLFQSVWNEKEFRPKSWMDCNWFPPKIWAHVHIHFSMDTLNLFTSAAAFSFMLM